jgi:hypothetical protein
MTSPPTDRGNVVPLDRTVGWIEEYRPGVGYTRTRDLTTRDKLKEKRKGIPRNARMEKGKLYRFPAKKEA